MLPCGLFWASVLRCWFFVWSFSSMRSDATRANWRRVILIPKNSKFANNNNNSKTNPQQQPEHKKSATTYNPTTTNAVHKKNNTKYFVKTFETQQKVYILVNKLQIKDVWSCIRNAQQTHNTHTHRHTHTDICDVLTHTQHTDK